MTARAAERAIARAVADGGPGWVDVAGTAALVLARATHRRRPTVVLPPAPTASPARCRPFQLWRLSTTRRTV